MLFSLTCAVIDSNLVGTVRGNWDIIFFYL